MLKGGSTSGLGITPCIWFLLMLVAMGSAACVGGSKGVIPAASPAPAATATPVIQSQTSTPVAPTSDATPVVTVGKATFKVELAITQEQRTQGLSGRDSLAPGAGMLFVFDEEGRYSFWMKDMRFPLDLVWIGPSTEGCTVVDITHNAPPPTPGRGLAELPLYTPEMPARYVLEVNGGATGSAGIRVGDRVAFSGFAAEGPGRYGC